MDMFRVSHPDVRLRPALPAISAVVGLLALTACSGSGQTTGPSSPAASSERSRTTSTQPATPYDRSSVMRIQLTLDGHPVRATLNESPAAQDFAALLPLSLELEDFHRTERVADLPRKLGTSGAPVAPTPRAGDLAHYAPWRNLALFYRDGEASPGLVVLGHLDDSQDIDRLATADRVTIKSLT
ncbi:cyclophilin-like fold protein [Streptomyces sp. NBC_01320]|uniref:cyclophilin-like fold protein n=1 Tax=Streptomyces sp. NBC_01320 TaxID=2903824 RepID=UPI002E13CD24|nr:cyclophilin-like fold protein [Streptomyces sp. NBC_01320]